MTRTSHSCLSLLLAVAAASAAGCSTVDSSVRADITRQMEAARGAYTTCYSSALEQDRTLRGSMTLAFRVEPKSGRFSSVAVQDGLAHPGLRNCVVATTRRLRLGRPVPVAMSVTYPLSFSPAP